jgi:nucleotide-binding universal stress UspA family protein
MQVRRILVPLDASAASLAALAAAVELAERMDAELVGLFVEDVRLLHLAALPFASERGVFGSRGRPLNPEGMEQSLRAQAARAELALSEAAGRRRLRWTFRVARGQVLAEVLVAMDEVDLTALGTVGVQQVRRAQIGNTAREVINRATHPVLILPPGGTVRASIAAVFDGSPASLKALVLASAVAEDDGGDLVVLLVAADPDDEQRLRQAATSLLQELDITPHFVSLAEANSEALARAIRRERVCTVVLAAGSVASGADTARLLLEGQGCAVLWVP